MALTQALLSGGRCGCTRAAPLWAASRSRSRAQPHRTFGKVRESDIMKKKLKSPKYTAKVEDAENQWDFQAEKIKRGVVKNLWDVFEERGFIKDTAG